jgi:hypothetical protein
MQDRNLAQSSFQFSQRDGSQRPLLFGDLISLIPEAEASDKRSLLPRDLPSYLSIEYPVTNPNVSPISISFRRGVQPNRPVSVSSFRSFSSLSQEKEIRPTIDTLPEFFQQRCVVQILNGNPRGLGQQVRYGQLVQFFHPTSRSYLAVSATQHDTLTIQAHETLYTYFRLLPRFKLREEGEPVLADDVLMICPHQSKLTLGYSVSSTMEKYILGGRLSRQLSDMIEDGLLPSNVIHVGPTSLKYGWKIHRFASYREDSASFAKVFLKNK